MFSAPFLRPGRLLRARACGRCTWIRSHQGSAVLPSVGRMPATGGRDAAGRPGAVYPMARPGRQDGRAVASVSWSPDSLQGRSRDLKVRRAPTHANRAPVVGPAFAGREARGWWLSPFPGHAGVGGVGGDLAPSRAGAYREGRIAVADDCAPGGRTGRAPPVRHPRGIHHDRHRYRRRRTHPGGRSTADSEPAAPRAGRIAIAPGWDVPACAPEEVDESGHWARSCPRPPAKKPGAPGRHRRRISRDRTGPTRPTSSAGRAAHGRDSRDQGGILAGDAAIVVAAARRACARRPRVHLRNGTKEWADTRWSNCMIRDGLWDAFNGYTWATTAENDGPEVNQIIPGGAGPVSPPSQQRRLAAPIAEGRFKDETIRYGSRPQGDTVVDYRRAPGEADTTRRGLGQSCVPGLRQGDGHR